MKWRSYLIFGLLSLVVSALSVVLWMINPFTDLLLLLAAPPLRLLGYHPPVQGWSGLGSAMLISFLWPLTLSPLHWQFPTVTSEKVGVRRFAFVGKLAYHRAGVDGQGRIVTRASLTGFCQNVATAPADVSCRLNFTPPAQRQFDV